MKHNLLKNVIVVTTLSAGFMGCGDGSKSITFNASDIDPVQVSGDISIIVDEMSGVIAFDLLEGVTNPNDVPLFTRSFTYVKEDTSDEANPVSLFVGPNLPNQGVYKQTDTMFINTDAWIAALVHPATVEQSPFDPNVEGSVELFSQGVYKFTYLLDNGSETIVERNITITVNGVEDKVQDISLNPAPAFEAPIGYQVPLKATITPFNATFPEVSWSSSDDAIATVTADGMVEGQSVGMATITATSADGSIVRTSTANVALEATAPIGINLLIDGEKPQLGTTDLAYGTSMQLQYALLPIVLGFDDTVEWTSSDPEIATVDASGLVTAIKLDEAANMVTITGSIVNSPLSDSIELMIVPNPNLLFDGNPGFESGELGQNWEAAWNNEGIIEVRAEAAKDGNFGLYVVANPGDVRFVSTVAAMRNITFNPDKMYRASMDVKNIDGGGWAGGPMNLYSNDGEFKGVYPNDNWWGIGEGEWQRQSVDIPGADIINNLDTNHIQIQWEMRSGGVTYYIDNMAFEEVIE